MSAPLDVGALFDEHHEGLFRYLVRLSGDEAVAKDAVQFAFLRMLERRPSDDNPQAWLYRVATNAIREWGRSASRHRELQTARGYPPALGDPADDPSRTVESIDNKQRLDSILDRLSQRERTILLMREQGFTHREIAKAVGTTPGSVGTLLARALTKAGRIAASEAS